MLIHAKILIRGAYKYEKMPKTGFRNVANVYLKARKNQTNGDRDLKYGLKWLLECFLIDLGRKHAYSSQNLEFHGDFGKKVVKSVKI